MKLDNFWLFYFSVQWKKYSCLRILEFSRIKVFMIQRVPSRLSCLSNSFSLFHKCIHIRCNLMLRIHLLHNFQFFPNLGPNFFHSFLLPCTNRLQNFQNNLWQSVKFKKLLKYCLTKNSIMNIFYLNAKNVLIYILNFPFPYISQESSLESRQVVWSSIQL